MIHAFKAWLLRAYFLLGYLGGIVNGTRYQQPRLNIQLRRAERAICKTTPFEEKPHQTSAALDFRNMSFFVCQCENGSCATEKIL